MPFSQIIDLESLNFEKDLKDFIVIFNQFLEVNNKKIGKNGQDKAKKEMIVTYLN